MGLLDWLSVEKTIELPNQPAPSPAPVPRMPPQPGPGWDEAPAPTEPPGQSPSTTVTKNLVYLEPGSLTFPGVTLIAGIILNFVLKNSGMELNVFWFSGAVALVFGALLMWVGLTSKENKDAKPKQIVTGVINSVVLWITIFGVAQI
jgi:hypothetical protein